MVFALYDVATYDLACCAFNYVHLCDESVYYIICFNHTLRYHANIAYVKFFLSIINSAWAWAWAGLLRYE